MTLDDIAHMADQGRIARLREALEQAARDPYISAKGTELIYQALKGAGDGSHDGGAFVESSDTGGSSDSGAVSSSPAPLNPRSGLSSAMTSGLNLLL